ncbi:MAG: radical SAM family heme chaperone HemW [Bacteroidota bacterium]
MAGLYLHIPFCKQACHYCDFHFSTNLRLKAGVLQAIAEELSLQRDYLCQAPLASVYLGGGTPSLLTAPELASLLEAVARHFVLPAGIEVTLEANPDDITIDKLRIWKQLGINRLSIGIQSFQDTVLQAMNRAHNSQEAKRSVELAYQVGFRNVSIDLMYATPGLTQAMWEADLATAMELRPVHIAAYCLTIEPNTAFGRWHQQGKLRAVQEEIVVQQFNTLVDTLSAHHYEHYEVASFCQRGRYAQHNTNYWKQGSYLGIGPGAHSYNGTTRQHNVRHNARYIACIQQGTVPCTIEELSHQDHTNEYIMTSLRTQWGCDLNRLKKHYGYCLQETAKPYLKQLFTQKLVFLQGSHLVLTQAGKLLADKITAGLFVT